MRAELGAGLTVAFVIAGCVVVLAADSLVAYGTAEYFIVFAGES